MHAYQHLYAKMAGLVACPECHEPAHVLERVTLESTDGPLEHVKVRCHAGHWFTLPADRVVAYATLHGDRAA
jgi:hypothetical protein